MKMKNPSIFKGIGIIVAVVAAAIGLLLLSMVGLSLTVFFGWLAGHILCFFAGGFIVKAIMALLGIFGINTTVTVGMIPFITGALAFFGYFFKSTNIKTNNND